MIVTVVAVALALELMLLGCAMIIRGGLEEVAKAIRERKP